MVSKYKNKNLLPLLAITALFLSVGLVNITQVSDSKVTKTQSVLSESDENKVEEVEIQSKDRKREEKKDEKKDENKEKEQKKIETEIKTENEQRLTTGKIEIDEVEDENEAKDDANDDKDEPEDKTKMESEFEQESETVSSDGSVNKFKFKLKTKTVNGKTIIETSSGEMEVKNNPEDSVDELINAGVIDTQISFEAKSNDNNKVEFEVQGVEIKKLLGLFEVSLPKTVTVDSETGTVINTNQNIWTRFLSMLSI